MDKRYYILSETTDLSYEEAFLDSVENPPSAYKRDGDFWSSIHFSDTPIYEWDKGILISERESVTKNGFIMVWEIV